MFNDLLDELEADEDETDLTDVGPGESLLLSPEEMDELLGKDVSLPAAFLQTNAHRMRSTDAIVDFATTVCVAVSQGQIKVGQSAELRKWAELMYTCIATNKNGNNTQVNYIGQLVQLAGTDPTEDREVIQVQEAIRTKKAQGE